MHIKPLTSKMCVLLPLDVSEVFEYPVVGMCVLESDHMNWAKTSAFSRLAHSSLSACRPEPDLLSPSLPLAFFPLSSPFQRCLSLSFTTLCQSPACVVCVLLIWCSTSAQSDKVISGEWVYMTGRRRGFNVQRGFFFLGRKCMKRLFHHHLFDWSQEKAEGLFWNVEPK